MHNSSLSSFVIDFTNNKVKTTNTFYFATAIISILGLLTSISYTAMYGYAQGTLLSEKICNAIAYSLIDTMLALFFIHMGRRMSEKGRALQDLKIQFLGIVLFCLSSLAMVADLSKQSSSVKQQHLQHRVLTMNEEIKAYNNQILNSITQLDDANALLKSSLEKIDATTRPGNYQFLVSQIEKNISTQKELQAKIKSLKSEEFTESVDSLNAWIAKQLNSSEETMSIIIKSIWAIFFIAGFTTVAGLHASIYCDESLIWAFKRRQRLELRALKNAAKHNIRIKRAGDRLKKSKSRNIRKLQASIPVAINRENADTTKYSEITKKLLTDKIKPTQRWIRDEFDSSKQEAKMFLSWMLVDGIVKQYANRQYILIAR